MSASRGCQRPLTEPSESFDCLGTQQFMFCLQQRFKEYDRGISYVVTVGFRAIR